MLCCVYTSTDFPISIRLTLLALWQSNDCPSVSKATLINMDEYFMWIHYERLHNHNKAKHNKTVCIFLGIYCMCQFCSLGLTRTFHLCVRIVFQYVVPSHLDSYTYIVYDITFFFFLVFNYKQIPIREPSHVCQFVLQTAKHMQIRNLCGHVHKYDIKEIFDSHRNHQNVESHRHVLNELN